MLIEYYINMEEQNRQEKSSIAVKLGTWWRYIRKLFIIHESTYIEATMMSINQSVEFKGVNIWILFFAILIASIGLNVNSTAVIIGAMLISPLMGPINGIGLAVGIYDMDLLKRSAHNLFMMVLISLFASTLYFLLSPLGDAQSELLARTRPTIFDVLIATFGGLAGIVASSRKSQPFTVISGVAIATALMPPLCTAGFGLATWQLRYFAGAFYLFFINSFFIAFSTFLMVRYLHFPKHKFMDAAREKLVKRSIAIMAVIVVVPSIFAAINVVKETVFNKVVGKLISDIQSENLLGNNTELLSYEKSYDRKSPQLTLSVVGGPISAVKIDSLKTLMHDQYGLASTQLTVRQMGIDFGKPEQNEVMEKLLQRREDEVRGKEVLIEKLRDSLEMIGIGKDSYAEKSITLAKRYASAVSSISIVDVPFYSGNNVNAKTHTIIYIRWKQGAERESVLEELRSWAPTLLGVEKVEIVSSE